MKRTHGWLAVAAVTAAAGLWAAMPIGAALGAGGAGGAGGSANEGATTQPAAAVPSADQVMKKMDKMIDANPAIESVPRTALPRETSTMDPNVLGPAPGEKPVKLRQEGEFVVNRMGRITRAPNSSNVLFVFEADSKAAPEAPMILLPCSTLQNMENLVQERGDRIIFKLSGQITTYRGANYLLPTTMMLALDRGNLQK